MTRVIVIIRNINTFQRYWPLTIHLGNWLPSLIACFSYIKYFSSYGLPVNLFSRILNSLLAVGGHTITIFVQICLFKSPTEFNCINSMTTFPLCSLSMGNYDSVFQLFLSSSVSPIREIPTSKTHISFPFTFLLLWLTPFFCIIFAYLSVETKHWWFFSERDFNISL